MNLFEKFKLSKELFNSIERMGFEKPTEIQEKSIPHVVEGKDILGESATGSGKTLAFGVGAIESTLHGRGIQTLVLTPTRELAEQVKDELKKISKFKNLNVTAVYGGVAINPQIFDLRKADIVVGTPGRLLDHLERGTINVSNVKVLVLDEADRMLDMGFIDDVEKIIKECPKQRQTLFFSATLAPEIKSLANKYMKNPVSVSAKKHVDPSKLKQVYYDISKGMKFSLLVHLLKKEKAGLVMVFCNTRSNTDFVVQNLKLNKISAIAIHGGLTQNKRTNTLSSFNKGKVEVLVCTDVAARGLHIDNVSHVYNYDLPRDAKDYVHRIGRTARAGEEGKVINLLSNMDHPNFSRILDEYRTFKIDSVKEKDIPKIKVMRVEEDRKGPRRRGGFGRGVMKRRKR